MGPENFEHGSQPQPTRKKIERQRSREKKSSASETVTHAKKTKRATTPNNPGCGPSVFLNLPEYDYIAIISRNSRMLAL